jgi:hypothetical protein
MMFISVGSRSAMVSVSVSWICFWIGVGVVRTIGYHTTLELRLGPRDGAFPAIIPLCIFREFTKYLSPIVFFVK